MTVDVATLVFEFKSDSAMTAEQRMDGLIAKGEKLEAVAKRVRLATDRVNEGHRGAAGAAERSAQGATALAAAEGAVERAAQASSRASAALRAQRQLEAAAMREVVAADKAYERSLQQTAAAVERLRLSTDPLAAAQARVNGELAEANRLYKMGAISTAEHANAQRVLSGRLDTITAVHGKAAGGAKLQAYELSNLGAQFADIGVSLASGQALWLVAIQQGAQIAAIWGDAAARGVVLKAALDAIATGAMNLLRQFGALIATLTALGVAILAAVEGYNQMKAAQDAAKDSSAGFANAMAVAEEAINGVAIATFKLADARKEAARQGLAAEMAENSKRLNTMENPGFWGSVGRGVGTIVGTYRGAEVARETELMRQRQAALMKQSIALTLQGPTDRDAAKLLDQVLPKEAAMVRIREERAQVEEFVRRGLIDSASAQRAYIALDKQATDLLKEKKGALSDGEKASRKAERASEAAAKSSVEELKRAKEATAEYITGLEQQVRAAGATSLMVRRLNNDREAEKALLRGDMESALRIKGLVLEVEKLEELGRALTEIADLRKAALDNVSLVGGAADPFQSLPRDLSFSGPDRIKDLADAFEQARVKASDVSYAVEDIYYSIKNNDWVGAFSGLFRALDQVVKAFKNGASSADRFAAVASLAQGVGNAIGGKTGGAISGAASGAMAGFTLTGGNPIGAVVGGLLGGVASLFGSSRKKAEERERAAEAARQRAAELAATRLQNDIRILELQGKKTEALAKSREAELAAMDATLRAQQEMIWALEDQAEALAKLADLTRSTKSLQADILGAQGRTGEATAIRRAMELEGVDPMLQPLQRAAWALSDARDAALDAYSTFKAAKEAEIAALRQTADALMTFRKELDIGDIAGRDPVSQYIATRREFDRLSAMEAGNPERVANLEGVGRAFLDASRNASPTQLAFERDLNAVRRATTASAEAAMMQASIAEAELAAQTAQMQALGLIAGNTGTMADALNAYAQAQLAANAALTAQLAALAAREADLKAANDNKPAAFDPAAYLQSRPDVLAEFNRHTSNKDVAYLASLGIYDALGFATWHHNQVKTGVPGFAAGGMHMGGLRIVGEEGPELEATGPSRIYSAQDTARMLGGDTERLEALVASLTEEVAGLRKEQREANRNLVRDSKDTADILADVTQGGTTIRTTEIAA